MGRSGKGVNDPTQSSMGQHLQFIQSFAPHLDKERQSHSKGFVRCMKIELCSPGALCRTSAVVTQYPGPTSGRSLKNGLPESLKAVVAM